MLFHLLGAGQPIANFTSASQTVNEADGVWADWSAVLSAWTRRREIRLDGAAGALSNFPVMIKLDASRIDYAQTQAAGQDLRFTDNSGALLSYEIENWDEAGISVAWVKVPTLAAYPTANVIWMYYGNVSASDTQTKTAVWDANHSAVWHLSGNASDSTSAAKNGTATGVTYGTGLAGQSLVINGTAGNNMRPPDSMLTGVVFTVSAWFKTTSNGVIVGHSNVAYSGGPGSWDPLLYVGTDGMLRGGTYSSGNPNLVSTQTVSDGQWHYAVLTGNTNTQSLYLDGALQTTYGGTLSMASMIYNYIGMGHWSGWPATSGAWSSFNGQIDEVSFSTVVRSLDWISASYASGKDTLAIYGPEQTPTSGAAIITVGLNTPATSTITIPYTVSGTATAGTDHSRVSGNLTINGGSSSGSLDARIFRDNVVEGSEAAILTLGAPTGASLGPDTVHTVTITDEALSPPDAVDDSLNITNFNAVTIPVLSNDTDANGDTLTITAVGSPTAGTAVRVGQTIRYTPTQDFPASDSFTYTISDGRGGTDTATVTLSYQIPFTWIGSGADANWTTTANWLGGVVPGVSDTAYFNNQCTTYCNPSISGNVSVAGLRMNSSFSGTIAQNNTNTITIGTSGWLQRAGTFTGGNSTITLSTGSFNQIGGSFTTTSGTMLFTQPAISGNFTLFSVGASATFVHNSGTVQFNANSAWGTNPTFTIDAPDGFSLYNVVFHQAQAQNNNTVIYAPTTGRTINILGNLTHGTSQYVAGSGASKVNGSWQVQGNLTIGSDAVGGTGSVTLVGTAAQTIVSDTAGYTADLIINKAAGTVTASSTILRVRRFLLDQGTFVAPSALLDLTRYRASGTTTVMRIAAGTTFTIGTANLNISADSEWGVNATYEIDVPDLFQFNAITLGQATAANNDNLTYRPVGARTIVATGTLAFGTSAFTAASAKTSVSGLWEARANYSVGTEVKGGSASVTLTGTAAQSVTIASTAIAPSGTFTVNKASGTASLTASASFNVATQDVTIASGILNLAGFNLVVNDVLTVSSGAKLLCNGGVVTAGSSSISGEISCGTSLGITWLGTTGDGLWSTAGNWTNNTIPGASDIAYFNGSCTNCNATVNSAISVKGIVMASAYTGTLTQSNTVTVGTSGWSIAGGTFAGGSSAVSINGTLAISGGTYTATSATTSIGITTGSCSTTVPLNMTAGTFNHGSGRLKVFGGRSTGAVCNSTAQLFFPVGFTAYDLELAVGTMGAGWHSSLTATSATTLTVARNFYDYGHTFNFTIDVKGDLFSNRTEDLGAGLVKMTGTVDQYYTFTGGSKGSPTLQIDKPSGTVQPAGGVTDLRVWSLELLQGGFVAPSGNLFLGADSWSTVSHNALLVASGTTFNTNSGTIKFNLARMGSSNATQNISVPAGFTFNHVEINGYAAGSGWYDYITSGTTLVVDGNLLMAGKINNASWDVKGNITVNGNAQGGTGTIRAVGSANQTVTGIVTAKFPHFTIASTGGVVTFSGSLYFSRNFTYTSGTVDAGTSNVTFYADTGFTNAISAGPITFNNVTLSGYQATLTVTGVVDVAGALSVASASGSPPVSINTGTVLARGNVSFSSYGSTGTGLIKIVGSGNQTVSGTATANIINFEVDSTGGTVTYSGTLSFIRAFTHTAGTVDAGTSTLSIASNSLTIGTYAITPGSVVYNNVSFLGYQSTYNIASAMTVNGALVLNSQSNAPAVNYNGGPLQAYGDVSYLTYGGRGNVPINFVGTTNATFYVNGSANYPTGTLTVNKTGGAKVTMSTNASVSTAGQDLTISSGTLDLGGFDLTVADVLTVGAGATLRCNGGIFTPGSLVNSGTINCPGYSGYEFNWTGAGGDANWSTAGNWSGGVAPSATSVVVFNDAYCGANCNSTISGAISVKGIQLLSPYTGTVTQASGAALTVGTRGWTQAAGAFSGGNSDITVAGGMNFTAGTLTSTSAMLQIRNTTTIAGTFNHNNGKLRLGSNYNTNRNISLGTLTVRDLEFYSESGYDSYQLNLTGTISVLGDLSFTRFDGGSPGAIYGGTLNVSGNITSNTNFYGSVAVRAVGSASQTITGASTSAVVPNLTIVSTGGTVSVIGTLGVYQSLTYTSGVVSFGTSTVTVVGAYNAAYALNLASLTFNNLTFLSECARDQVTFTITGNLNVSGNLDFNSTCATSSVTGGQINVSGNLSTSGSSAYNGTTPIYMTGSGAATLTQAGSGNFAKGNLTINKSAGAVVTQTSNVALSTAGQNLTIQAGTLNMAGYNLNVAGTLTNSSVLQRGSNPSCGTVTAGTYSGTAAICP